MTYRNNTEAENLRLKAELEKAQSELAELKIKYAPKPKKVEPVLVPEQSDKDRARYELESLLVPLKGYYPPNNTNRSFLSRFREPRQYNKTWLGFVAIAVIFTLSQVGVLILLANL